MINIGSNSIKNIMIGSTQAKKAYLGNILIWEYELPFNQQYFTIESLEDSNIIKIGKSKSPPNLSLSYSLDGGEIWTDLTISSGQNIVTINAGDKLLIKGINNRLASAWDNYYRFYANKTFKVYGNAMSLLFGNDFINNTEFKTGTNHNLCGLFYGTTELTDASNLILPALTCTNGCYNGMFRGCTNLTAAPQLPAIESAYECYSSMFEGCINLEIAPEINLINMAQNACCRMFCMNRNSKITTPRMTKGPILRVATPVVNCYKDMFKGNGNINEVTCLITTSGISCTDDWLLNAGNGSGTFRKSSLKGDWGIGTKGGVPTGWTIEDYVEE